MQGVCGALEKCREADDQVVVEKIVVCEGIREDAGGLCEEGASQDVNSERAVQGALHQEAHRGEAATAGILHG